MRLSLSEQNRTDIEVQFHGAGTYSEEQSFLGWAMQWMDQQFWISNYAWFMLVCMNKRSGFCYFEDQCKLS